MPHQKVRSRQVVVQDMQCGFYRRMESETSDLRGEVGVEWDGSVDWGGVEGEWKGILGYGCGCGHG